MRLFPAFLAAITLLLPVGAVGGAQPLPVETKSVDTGSKPCGTATRSGTLWIGVYGNGRVLQIDGRGRVTRRTRVGPWACRVAVDDDAVWVTRDQARELVRIDRRTQRLLRVEVDGQPFDVLLAAGSVWTTGFDSGTVTRLDPRTGRVRNVVRVGGNPAGLASCGGRVWVGHGRSATWLTSINQDGSHARRVPVGAIAPGWPRCVRGELWVTTPDSVLRLTAPSGRVLSRLRIGETLAHAAEAPDGLVWVTDKQHSLVHRLSPSGRTVVDSFPAGPGAFALARLGNSMWVTSFAGMDVRRYDP